MPWTLRLTLAVAALGSIHEPVVGQSDCEAGVRHRLAIALEVEPKGILITRDYSPGLFPGVTFFRAHAITGFHTRLKVAALAVVKDDSLLVRDVDDLGPLWHLLFHGSPPEPRILSSAVPELLFQAGFLGGSDRVISSAGEISSSYRAFLPPGSDLSAVRAPERRSVPTGEEVTFFAQTSEGVLRYVATIPKDGRLKVTKEVVARFQAS